MPGLYVHIPFCQKHCPYCHFATTATGNESEHQSFLRAIKAEAEFAKNQYGLETFDTVYIGGGTPSALRVDETKELFKILRSSFSWPADAEVTMEINPGEVDAQKAQVYKELGVNRISLGAQTFHDHHLERLGRIHRRKAIVEVFRMLREYQFKSINMDLMIRLPDETLVELNSDLEKLCGCSPEHISVYDLAVDQGTAFERLHKAGKLNLPSEETHLEMEAMVQNILCQNGYNDYALSCFSKPEHESKHNLNYWYNGEYLGLGPSAYSYIKGVRFQRALDYVSYMTKIRTKDFDVIHEDVIDDVEKEAETFLLRLRLKNGAPLSRFKKYLPHVQSRIDELVEMELMEWYYPYVRMTMKGRAVAEEIFARLVLGSKEARTQNSCGIIP